MNKIMYYIGVFLLSFIAMGFFNVDPYIVVFLLICFFAYDYHQVQFKLERQNEKESKELKNEIKSTSKDNYLKQKQLITLVRSIPYPLVLMDDNGNVVMYNTHFNVFRSSNEERDINYLYNDCVDEVSEFLKDSYIFEKRLVKVIHHNNKTYEAVCQPVTTNGKFSGSLILFQDVTKAKENEVMQKQFIADASHELKTPISVIKGMMEILNREDFDDEEIRKDFMHQIEKENRRMEIIVRDLLILSRLSKDKLVMRKQSVDFTKILDECIDSFITMANDKNLKIEKNYQDYSYIKVDKELSKTLINNLISNAIKYSDEGVITVSTYEEEKKYVVTIKDQGVGLSKEDKEKVFERFYRVDKARSRASGGSGLGLSIVKSITDAHDATISVESEEGIGSEFKIYFNKTMEI